MTGLDNYEMENKPMHQDKTEYLDCINKVIHGDCLEVMQKIKPKSVDMILADLPYGITACVWDKAINFKMIWCYFNPLLKLNAPVLLFSSQPFTSQMVESNSQAFRYEWIWIKPQGTNPFNSKKMPLKKHETILVFANESAKYYPQMGKGKPYKSFNSDKSDIGEVYGEAKSTHRESKGDRYPTSILEFGNESGLHPTQKPVKLFEYLIKTYSKEGDTVLDCCAGSGTTGIACQNTNRNYILIEKEKKYIDVMYKRGLK